MTRTRRAGWLLGWAMVPVLGWVAVAWSQAPVASPPDGKKYTNKTVFHLPVKIDDAMRAQLRDVSLYVKRGAAGWERHETGLPTQSSFSYKVPQDGEYWFSLVTVDKAGQMTPPTLEQIQPALKVVVDTQGPQVDVQPWVSPEGGRFLRCIVKDANPDLETIKLVCNDGAAERLVDSVPGSPGLFPIDEPDMLARIVRVVASDRCGNVGQREITAQDLTDYAALFQASTVPVNVRMDPKTPVVKDVPAGGTPPIKVEAVSSVPLTPSAGESILPMVPPLAASQTLPPPEGLTQVNLPSLPEPAGTKSASADQITSGERQLLKTTKATLAYRIDQVGPSGVSKIDLWTTTDKGETWKRLAEDADHRSPAEIDLPGEGLYGIRLAVTNGNGFGGAPPVRGDRPICWIEVDTTAPFAQLKPIDPVTSGGTLDIRWIATDKNLRADPISLYFRTQANGPWQIMIRSLKNEGHYRWAFPRDMGNTFYIRLEAADQVGNVSRSETAQPVILDMTEPRASVISVTGLNP